MDISHYNWFPPTAGTLAVAFVLVTAFTILTVFLKLLSVSPRSGKFALTCRHVLVSGGSSGIGLAIAVEAVRRGARVTIIARNEQRLQEAAQHIRLHAVPGNAASPNAAAASLTVGENGSNSEAATRVKAISADIASNFDDVAKAVALAVDNQGPVDVLINCAGISIPKSFDDLSIDEFERMMRLNYFGSVMLTKLVVPQMKQRREGHIVFVSSMAGQVGLYGFSGYSASKFALRGLAEALHMELKPFNIGITVSYPPDTDTPGFAAENLSKPYETQLISDTAGLYAPEAVAHRLLDDVQYNNFHSYLGLDGFMLAVLTAGMAPLTNVRDGMCQLLFTGLFRFISLFYRRSFDRIVAESAASKAKSAAAKANSAFSPPASVAVTAAKEGRKSVTFKDDT